MKTDWLTTVSFERAFEIVSAVNTLSIHGKLLLANIPDPTPISEIDRAKLVIRRFLEALELVMSETAGDDNGIVLGVDPRFNELALHYKDECRRIPARAKFYTISPAELKTLVGADGRSNVPLLIECLDALRTMVEEWTQVDVASLFGDE